jgi:hypothetical protein
MIERLCKVGVWIACLIIFQVPITHAQTSSILTAPANGAVISPQQVQFNWTAVAGATQYTLWIGTSPNTSNAYYYGTTATSAVTTLQPGITYYVTLWTNNSGTWTYTTSQFQTSATSILTSPANGATTPSRQIQFSWAPVPGATQYTIWVGTSPNTSNALYYGTTGTSTTATLQPDVTYYVTLWTNNSGSWSYTTSTFTTPSASYLTFPANGASVSAQQIQFTWAPIIGATAYTLWVGTSPGAQDALYYGTANSPNSGLITSVTATLQPGKIYYATLWTNNSGTWFSATSIFQTASTAYLTTPANGTTVSPQAQFNWSPVSGATQYTLWIGTSPNASDVFYYGTTGTTASTLLQPGTTYYATLWTNNSGTWTYTSSSFKTSSQIAVINSPGYGATTLDPSVPLQISWTPVINVTQYTLWVGTSPGTSNVFYSGSTATSASVPLQPNTTYYARLWTDINGSWYYTDTKFSTGYPRAHLTYPADGATNVNPFQPFTWNQVPNANGYTMAVSPTGYGVFDFFNGTQYLIPSATSEYVWGLQPNTKYYVQLCTGNPDPGGGDCVQSTFTTGAAPPVPSDRNAFYQSVQNLTAQVRLMTQGFSNIPIPGSYLAQYMTNHGGDPTQAALCGWFSAALLDEFAMNGILGRERNVSLDGWDGHVIAEYWDPFNQKWQVADATFGLIYFDPNSQMGQSAEDVNSLLLANNLSGIHALYVTSYENKYMTSYYMDPITTFNNVDPFGMLDGQTQLNYMPNSPLPFLNDITSTGQGTPGPIIFHFANQNDSITIQNGSSTVKIVPGNTEGWASSLPLNAGWSIISPIPGGMTFYTFNRVLF